MEYHQAPLVVSAAVTAIPSNAPLSTSLTLSTCPAGEAKSTRAETSVPTAPEGAPESSFWAVKAGLLVLSNTGASLTALTVMVATTVLPPRPASPLAVEAWTVKLPLPLKLAVGVNLSPALPSANVMNVPLLIGVVPSFLYSVPLLIPVILKCVTSAPSAALREHQPAGRLRVLVGRGIGHRRRVGHRVDHQAGGVGGGGEGRRTAVAGGVGQGAARAAGLVPGAEGEGAGQGAVVVGVGLEVEPRVGIRRQQTRVVVGDRSQSVPTRTVVGGVPPGAVGRVGRRDGDPQQRAAVHLADVVHLSRGRSQVHQGRNQCAHRAGGRAESSFWAVKAGLLVLSNTGASLTALTTRLAVSVAVEKAVVPPLLVVSARVPLVPLVWSQARKVRALARVPL